MNSLLQKMSAHPKFGRASEFFKLMVITGSAQLIVQMVSLICGIVIIRLLPTQEYAFYTLANAMLGTMSLLSDGGISTAVMSQGGKVWDDKEKLGVVLFTGMKLRKKFSFLILMIMLPILAYLLIHQKAGSFTTILIIFSVIPAYYASMSDAVLEIVPKLHQDIKPLQKNQLFVNCSRLLFSCAFLFFFPWAFIATLAAGISRIIGNIKLRALAEKFTISATHADRMVEREIIAVVKRSLPGIVYYCLSGQITIWILSIFGSSLSLAASGALSRLGMALNVITVMFATLIVPRFARLSSSRKLLMNRFLQIFAATIIMCLIVQVLVLVFAHQLLLILGPEYLHLDKELFVYFLASNITLLISTCFGLYASRGWIIIPTFSIAYNIFFLILGVVTFDVSSLMGVLWFTLFVNCSQLLMHLPFAIYKINMIDERSLGSPDSMINN